MIVNSLMSTIEQVSALSAQVFPLIYRILGVFQDI